jgi:hypothetical protein
VIKGDHAYLLHVMWEDPIVEEVRKVRDRHAAQFHYDLEEIYRDLKRQEIQSGKTFVSHPPRRIPATPSPVPERGSG